MTTTGDCGAISPHDDFVRYYLHRCTPFSSLSPLSLSSQPRVQLQALLYFLLLFLLCRSHGVDVGIGHYIDNDADQAVRLPMGYRVVTAFCHTIDDPSSL